MVKATARKIRRHIIHKVLSLDDTPHRIALGVAIGFFVAWTPTIGIQMILTVALATLLRANKFVGVPVVWLSNPLTLVPVYYPSYRLGCWLIGMEPCSARQMLEILQLKEGWLKLLTNTMDILIAMSLGSLIIGLALATVAYYVTKTGVRKYRVYRMNHPRRRLRHFQRLKADR